MGYNGVIQRKLAVLDKYLSRLQHELEDVDIESFKGNWSQQRMAERVLMVCVEIVVDIAERIIALKNAGPAATAAEAVEKLVELKVIKSVQPYINMVKFRNLIVHQYQEIDPEIVFDIAKNKLESFRQFRDEIDRL
ncbi:MAG: type VII toxin-antitoxin system HepT family RNase toxin [Planctomycetota bacterium]